MENDIPVNISNTGDPISRHASISNDVVVIESNSDNNNVLLDVPSEANDDGVDIATIDLNKYSLGCRICPQIFETKFGYIYHVRRHRPQCINCHTHLKHWNDLKSHENSCSRRFGIVEIIRPDTPHTTQHVAYPHHCSFCGRKYQTAKHLLKHQTFRSLFTPIFTTGCSHSF